MSVELGGRLRQERRRRKETQDQAAARFGIAQSSYHRWESGEHRPEPDQFGAIAGYIGATVEEVWAMVHQGRTPATLEELRSEIAGLARDLDDMRSTRERMEEMARENERLAERVSDLEDRLRRRRA